MSRLYQVQSIRGHKEVDGQVQYLVHWKKYSDDHDSWEPVANLKDCDKIIEEYEMKLKRQSTPKRQTRTRMMALPRRSSRLAMQNTEVKASQDSDVESNKDLDVKHSTVDNADKKDNVADLVEVEEKKMTRQIKRRSQPNTMVADDASKDSKEKKRVFKRRSHSNLVATGDSIDDVVDNLKSYDLRQRVQPMPPPVQPTPSTAILLSSDEEAEILSRRPVRKGRSPHRKMEVAPDPTENNEKPYTVVKSVSKYKVTVQEGNLLVRKREAKEPTEAATFKDDEEKMKPAEPIISDVEEEEIVTPSQVVVSAAASTTSATTTSAATTTTTATTTYPGPPRWMFLNCAEFLLALLLTALFFITYWCWNSDVC